MAHSTRIQEAALVSHFSLLMQDALESNRESKEVWTEIDVEVLIECLQENKDELIEEFYTHCNPDEIKKRCVNIANFAAMVAERYSK